MILDFHKILISLFNN